MSKQTWHPYTEPPDNMRQVMLRFDPDGKTEVWKGDSDEQAE